MVHQEVVSVFLLLLLHFHDVQGGKVVSSLANLQILSRLLVHDELVGGVYSRLMMAMPGLPLPLLLLLQVMMSDALVVSLNIVGIGVV